MVALFLLVAACTPIVAAPQIPEMPVERVPRPPPSTVNLIWQPGHFDWDGGGYRWIPGEWVPTEGHRRLWQDGIWQRAGDTWVWSPAHWL